jgi:type IV pilus assembly protein PilB
VNCKAQFQPTEEMLMELGLRPEDVQDKNFAYGKGCDYCNNTGYRGRLGLYETMIMNEDMRELIMQNASTNLLRNQAVKDGMRLLRESGLLAIYEGITTIEEVVKETVLDVG